MWILFLGLLQSKTFNIRGWERERGWKRSRGSRDGNGRWSVGKSATGCRYVPLNREMTNNQIGLIRPVCWVFMGFFSTIRIVNGTYGVHFYNVVFSSSFTVFFHSRFILMIAFEHGVIFLTFLSAHCPEKNFSPKKIFLQKKNFSPKKDFSPEKIFLQKRFFSRKDFSPEKKFSPKKIFLQKKFFSRKKFFSKKRFFSRKLPGVGHILAQNLKGGVVLHLLHRLKRFSLYETDKILGFRFSGRTNETSAGFYKNFYPNRWKWKKYPVSYSLHALMCQNVGRNARSSSPWSG